MAYTIMEKLDAKTPAYALRDFNHRQDALWQIHLWEKERGDKCYPQWSIVAVRMENDYPIQ
jgi:hypothetical protein